MMNTPTKQGAAAAAASTSSRTHLVFGAPPTPSSDPAYTSSTSASATAASAAAIAAIGLTPAPLTAAGTPSSPVSAIIDMLHDSARALFEYLRLTNSLQPGSIAESDRAKVATIVQHLTVVFNAAEGNQEQALTAAAVRQLAKLNGIDEQELDEYDQHIRMQAAGGVAASFVMHGGMHDDADGTGSHSGSDDVDNDSVAAAAAATSKKKPGRKPGPKPKGSLGAGGILNKPSFKSSPSSSSHASPSGGSTLGADGVKKPRGPRTALIRWSDDEWLHLQQQVLEHGRNFAKIISLHGPQGTVSQTLKRFEVKHLANKWANERAKRERSGLPRLPEKKLLGEEAAAADKAESAADSGDMSEIREYEDADGGDTVGMSSGATTPVSHGGGGGGASALGLQAESGEDAHMSEAQDEEEEDELMDDV